MATNVSGLESALLPIFRDPPFSPDPFVWGRRIADAYADYAAGAVSCSGGSPTTLAAARPLLELSLGAAFAVPPPASPPQTAQSLAAAFTAFWLLPPVVFSGPTPGAVSAVAGTAILQAALLQIWAAIPLIRPPSGDPAAASAAQHAAALDLFTKTIVVVHVPPSACAGPIF